jgi:hypothetical protein
VLSSVLRLDTGAPARIKPFAVEVRNVRCLRCGNYGHQSGDRECPLKDVIMPNEESRLKRDDPLTTIMAQTDSTEVRIFYFLFFVLFEIDYLLQFTQAILRKWKSVYPTL